MRTHAMVMIGIALVACGAQQEGAADPSTAADPTMTSITPECAPEECGPAAAGAVTLCPDGTTMAGPTGRCLRRADGSCFREATECPTEAAEGTVGAACGSRGLAPCAADQFCDFGEGSQCGADDRGGTCQPRPVGCTREYAPVCGCDGQTHSTACVANSHGVAVAHQGPC